MGTEKKEYDFPQVGRLSKDFRTVGFCFLVISIILSFTGFKGLNICVSFITLSIVTFSLSGAGLVFSAKGYVEKLFLKGIDKGEKEIISDIFIMHVILATPFVAIFFDQNIFRNVPYTITFSILYVIIIAYVLFLSFLLRNMLRRVFGTEL